MPIRSIFPDSRQIMETSSNTEKRMLEDPALIARTLDVGDVIPHFERVDRQIPWGLHPIGGEKPHNNLLTP